MPLYGHELSDTIDPFSAGLAWAIKLDKGDFVGRERARTIQGAAPTGQGGARAGRETDRPAGLGRLFGGDARSARSRRARFRRHSRSAWRWHTSIGRCRDRHAADGRRARASRAGASRQAAVLQTAAHGEAAG